MMRRMLWLSAVMASVVLVLMPSACGKTCDASNCAGCCDEKGVCQNGDTAATCGAQGASCSVCSGTCGAGVCVQPDAGVDAGTTADAGTGACTKTLVACSDTAIAQLDLKTTASPATIVDAANGAGWKSTIDTTGGGLTPTQSYVYAKFTATGLQKVSVDDQSAIDSMDWDIAFRRFVIRLNGGDSGPACTGAAALPDGTDFDTVTSVPAGATYEVDDFLSKAPDCTFQDDGSGLGTSPSTALASYYAYTSCLTMTKKVFVVQTSANKHVKLTVDTYYSTEAGQTSCNSSGTTNGAVGGTVRVRWAFLD